MNTLFNMTPVVQPSCVYPLNGTLRQLEESPCSSERVGTKSVRASATLAPEDGDTPSFHDDDDDVVQKPSNPTYFMIQVFGTSDCVNLSTVTDGSRNHSAFQT
jgi:hypothetical protein